jgi:hypothetical protein
LYFLLVTTWLTLCKSYLGETLTIKIVSEVLRAVFSFKNIRRAPGQSGVLKRFLNPDRLELRYAYLNQSQFLTELPTSLTVKVSLNMAVRWDILSDMLARSTTSSKLFRQRRVEDRIARSAVVFLCRYAFMILRKACSGNSFLMFISHHFKVSALRKCV